LRKKFINKNMKLEIAEFPVTQIRLGRRFSYENEVLEVHESALMDLVFQDPRITDASLAVAMPGEKTASPGFVTSSSHDIKSRGAAKFSPVF